MKKLLIFLFGYLSIFVTNQASAQTLCNQKCYTQKPYTFSSNPSEKLKAEKKWEIDNTQIAQSTIIYDVLNNDGIPEIIIAGPSDFKVSRIFCNKIFIIDTKIKSIAKTINTAYFRCAGVAPYIIADIEKDCKPNLIIIASMDLLNPIETRGKVIRYDLDGNIVWISDQKYSDNINMLYKSDGAALGLADFNKDGISEIYLGNEIFNAETGIKLCEGGNYGLGHTNGPSAGGNMLITCAADIDDDPSTLELAAGYTVYKVNITNPNGQAGNQMIPINLAYKGRLVEGSTNLADINGDGRLDVVVSSLGLNQIVKLYGYTIEADTARLLFGLEDSELAYRISAGGAVAIGRLHENQPIEIVFLLGVDNIRVGDQIISYSYIGTQKLVRNWSIRVEENTEVTGPIIFDLDNDGYKEVIHRDEESLKIIGVKNNVPTLLYQHPCISGTAAEMVRVADIDGSGQAKICVTCAETINDANGRLTIFGAPDGQRWAPARGIWNQYAYNPLFINDDGTVPQYMHNPATYQNGRYNNFMVQESLIDEDGNYPVPAASLTGSIDCIDYDAATDAYLVTFSMSNRSDASLTSPIAVPISLYDGDPSLAGRLLTTYRTTASLAAGSTLTGLTTSIPASSTSGRLYLVVNTDHIAPLTIDSSGYEIDECDYTDNVYQALLPTLTSTTASICTGETYAYYGRDLTTSGTYIHEVTDRKGCDSVIVRLSLVVKSCAPPCNTDTTTCKTTKKFNSDFKFDLEKKWETANIVGQYHTPIIMDLDNDCIPEIIIAGAKGLLTNWEAAKEILVINSIDGSIKKTISLPFYFMLSVQNLAILIIEGKVSIIISVEDENINSTLYRGKLVSVDLDGTINWISDTKFGINTPLSFRTLSIADFNQDGIPEVFLYNEIFNGKTGIKLIDGDSNGCGLGFGSVTLAANLDNDPNDLELIAGYTIYKVILTNPNGLIGNNMLAFNMTLDGTERDGMTALADINNDKQLDVIVQTYNTFYSAIYIYTFNNGKCELLASKKWNKFFGMGMVAIGRLNNTNRNYLVVPTSDTIRTFFYDNSIDLKEGLLFPIDNSTPSLGLTLFDFNGDGIHEIIYRGEKKLTITGIKNDVPFLIKSIPCISATYFEYPIVSTLQNPLISYICTTCSNSFYDLNGRLTVFGAPDGQRWAPARGIWHQYAYNPVYINDDGTVPQYMHNAATYKNGKYNNFMVQESLIDEDGNYPVPAASLTGSIDCIDYDAATDAYLVTFSMRNRSDASLTSPTAVPISLYDGDPSLAGRLLTTYRTTAPVAAGGTLSGLTASIPASSVSGRLYLVVNTDRIAPLAIDSSGYQIDECDYIDNVYQALLPTLASTTASICTGETYTYYGRVLTTSGTYIYEVPDSKGCDSVIVRLSLIVSDTKTQSLTQRECEVYVWRDTTILSSGTYVQRDLSVSGCDSITTLDLTIYPKYSTARTASSCDSFSYAGVRYTRDAMILDDRQSIYGCDSTTTIDLRIHPSITQDITRAACVSYDWDGTTYTQSGNYTYRGQTSMGCDSIINLALTISDVLSSTQAISGCDRYSWNGTTYTESGSYTYAGTSVSGCDSIATLDLSIGKSQSLTERATACDRYSWNGQLYTASGDYTYTTTNISGCDSTTVLSLTLNRSTTADIVQSSCGSYTWNGTSYTTSGNYSYLAQTSNGCDSTVNLVLTILAPDQIQAAATACGNYPWNGTTYDRSGTYTYQTLNGAGCDSIVTLDLTIHPVEQSSMSLTACDSVVLHGRTLRDSGDYRFELATQYGCDSIVTVSLTTQSDRQSISLTACDTYTWAATGDTYKQSGRYSASYTNVTGCDSTQVLNLQIAPSYLTTQNANACERYTWPTNQITYTESGDYTLALKTQAGCDSIQTLALRIDPVFEYRDTVTSATTYTWPINAQDYEQTGVYSEVFKSVSVCDSVYWLHLTIKSDIDIYTPNILSTNGTNNYFTLFSNNPSVAVETMNIYDRWGNLIYSKQNFPLNDPTSGWDGKMGGRAVVPGVYVWVAVLRLPDGTQVTKQGDVTVL